MGAAADPALDRLAVGLRVLVERGSIAYSAVTQPRPLPLRQRGTPWVTDAAHSTRVLPELDEHRALGVVEPAAGDAHVAQLVGGASVDAMPCPRP